MTIPAPLSRVKLSIAPLIPSKPQQDFCDLIFIIAERLFDLGIDNSRHKLSFPLFQNGHYAL